jgi:hypothetical protein
MRYLGYMTTTAAAIATVAALTTIGAAAQKTTDLGTGGGGSPHVKTEWTIDGAQLAVEYGRPFMKGRPEATLMPPGQPWRTGADVATILTTDKPLTFGTLKVAPGSYTINTQPGEPWQLILGKLGEPKQWGVPYKPDLEIGRAPMKAGKTAAPVEQVTISIDDTPAAGGTLKVEWGTTSASIPFTIG